MFQRPNFVAIFLKNWCGFIKFWIHLVTLESTQEARVALGCILSNSYASLVLSKLPICIHNMIYFSLFLQACRALARDIMLCSSARHFTLTVSLSIQLYTCKWMPANYRWGVTLQWISIPSRGEQKYSQSLHATETRIRSSLMSHLTCMQTLPFP